MYATITVPAMARRYPIGANESARPLGALPARLICHRAWRRMTVPACRKPLTTLGPSVPATTASRVAGWTRGAHHRGMSQPPEFVNMQLWKADAIVLFNWLMSVELNEVPITHRAEKQALMDLLTQLENQTGVLGTSQEEIDAARAEVSKNMGW
jgi:hypothetical protein